MREGSGCKNDIVRIKEKLALGSVKAENPRTMVPAIAFWQARGARRKEDLGDGVAGDPLVRGLHLARDRPLVQRVEGCGTAPGRARRSDHFDPCRQGGGQLWLSRPAITMRLATVFSCAQ